MLYLYHIQSNSYECQGYPILKYINRIIYFGILVGITLNLQMWTQQIDEINLSLNRSNDIEDLHWNPQQMQLYTFITEHYLRQDLYINLPEDFDTSGFNYRHLRNWGGLSNYILTNNAERYLVDEEIETLLTMPYKEIVYDGLSILFMTDIPDSPSDLFMTNIASDQILIIPFTLLPERISQTWSTS
jgi:hypothetical protein